MTREEIEELKELAASMGLYDDKNPCKRAVILGKAIKTLEQEPQTFKWCETCKEYDQEKHCCHRWSKVIRNTVEEMKKEQEPILDKIWSIVFPLSIMSTDKMEHEAIMQIAEMLEPLCLPESEG